MNVAVLPPFTFDWTAITGMFALFAALTAGTIAFAVDRVDDDRVDLRADVVEHRVRLAGGVVRALDEDLGAALLRPARLAPSRMPGDVEVRQVGQDEPDPVVGRGPRGRCGTLDPATAAATSTPALASTTSAVTSFESCFASTVLLGDARPGTDGAGGCEASECERPHCKLSRSRGRLSHKARDANRHPGDRARPPHRPAGRNRTPRGYCGAWPHARAAAPCCRARADAPRARRRRRRRRGALALGGFGPLAASRRLGRGDRHRAAAAARDGRARLAHGARPGRTAQASPGRSCG